MSKKKDPKLYWTSAGGSPIKISEMNTVHLINSVKLINRMADKGGHEYPECYDNMYAELESRGVDTDFEMNEVFKKL
tara:strand:+ start:78 stop:308 length:231 start_codon:yes stop_codon:yes gene_type:complete